MQEFAHNGFDKASTNKIVSKANIGKGMLFYYFKNKQELYQYLIDYALDIIMNDYLDRIDTTETDFIERFKQASQLKMTCYAENPHVLNFLGAILLKNENLSEENTKRLWSFQELGFEKLYNNIDTSLFRDDVDIDKAYQLIKWSIEGYQNDLLNRLKGKDLTATDMSPHWDEFYEYLEVLKRLFYQHT